MEMNEELNKIEQAAREAIGSDIGRDSFMDKIGGPERLLGVIQDAERYRWLRDAGATFYVGDERKQVCEWAMDAAIDAARRGGKGDGE